MPILSPSLGGQTSNAESLFLGVQTHMLAFLAFLGQDFPGISGAHVM
jgi:hypothetical protein